MSITIVLDVCSQLSILLVARIYVLGRGFFLALGMANPPFQSCSVVPNNIRSRIVVAIECLIIFIPNVFEAYFILNSYAIGMTISVVSRVSAVFLAHHRQKHDCN